MSTTEKTRAIELAEANEALMHPKVGNQLLPLFESNAAELRRQHGEIEGLRTKNEELTHKADDLAAKNEELRAQVEALSTANRTQHDADSRELRSLCAARDEARRKRDELSAENAGLQASISHLSELLDEQRALLADVGKECGTDNLGLPYEDGDSAIIDRVRAHLATLAAAPQPDQVAGPDVAADISADRQYIEGLKTGWNLSQANNEDAYQRIIASRRREIADAAPQPEQVAGPVVPEGYALVKSPINEEMHVAACKVLIRAHGLDGLPQRMLNALLAAAPQPEAAQPITPEQADALWGLCLTKYKRPGAFELINEFLAAQKGGV